MGKQIKVYKNGYIYSISFPNTKNYVGRYTSNLRKLKLRYLKEIEDDNSNRPVKKAIKYYGFENVKFEIIESHKYCTNDFLNKREVYFIKQLKSMITENGYNVSEGGHNGDNFTNNPRKEEIRETYKERWKKRPHPRLGSKLSGYTKKLIASKAKERLNNKKNHPLYNKYHSEEAKMRMSLVKKPSGKDNYNWKEPITNKAKLIKLIKERKTFRQIMYNFNAGQKNIMKSLQFYFGSKSLVDVRKKLEVYLVDKSKLKELLFQGRTLRQICLFFKCRNGTISKALEFYFGEYSITILRDKWGIHQEKRFLTRTLKRGM